MNPRRVPTRRAQRAEAFTRRRIAEKYLEVAELAATEDGIANNVAIGLAVLAGIAAGDAICIAAVRERYSGKDHLAAAHFLQRIDKASGDELLTLIELKSVSHYGFEVLGDRQRIRAMRAARSLVLAARHRT